MFARSIPRNLGLSAQTARMGGVRYNSSLPIPPKIATPQSVKGPGGSSARMDAVVDFYKSLPKGDAPQRRGGLKGRYFDGKNASGKPIVATLCSLLLIGYTLDYMTHLRKSPFFSVSVSRSMLTLRPFSKQVTTRTITTKCN